MNIGGIMGRKTESRFRHGVTRVEARCSPIHAGLKSGVGTVRAGPIRFRFRRELIHSFFFHFLAVPPTSEMIHSGGIIGTVGSTVGA